MVTPIELELDIKTVVSKKNIDNLKKTIEDEFKRNYHNDNFNTKEEMVSAYKKGIETKKVANAEDLAFKKKMIESVIAYEKEQGKTNVQIKEEFKTIIDIYNQELKSLGLAKSGTKEAGDSKKLKQETLVTVKDNTAEMQKQLDLANKILESNRKLKQSMKETDTKKVSRYSFDEEAAHAINNSFEMQNKIRSKKGREASQKAAEEAMLKQWEAEYSKEKSISRSDIYRRDAIKESQAGSGISVSQRIQDTNKEKAEQDRKASDQRKAIAKAHEEAIIMEHTRLTKLAEKQEAERIAIIKANAKKEEEIVLGLIRDKQNKQREEIAKWMASSVLMGNREIQKINSQMGENRSILDRHKSGEQISDLSARSAGDKLAMLQTLKKELEHLMKTAPERFKQIKMNELDYMSFGGIEKSLKHVMSVRDTNSPQDYDKKVKMIEQGFKEAFERNKTSQAIVGGVEFKSFTQKIADAQIFAQNKIHKIESARIMSQNISTQSSKLGAEYGNIAGDSSTRHLFSGTSQADIDKTKHLQDALKALEAEMLKLSNYSDNLFQKHLRVPDESLRSVAGVQREIDKIKKVTEDVTMAKLAEVKTFDKTTAEEKIQLEGLMEKYQKLSKFQKSFFNFEGINKNDSKNPMKEIERQFQQLDGLGVAAIYKYNVIVSALQGVSQNMYQFMQNAIGVYRDYEKELRLTTAIAKGTIADYELLNQTIQKTAMGMAVPLQSLATGSVYLAQAGLEIKDIIQILPKASMMAIGTGSDLNKVLETIVTTITGFNMSFDDSGKVLDIFAKSANNSMATIEKLKSSLSRVAPFAEESGTSLETVVTALSKLYNIGYNASMAGTIITNTMQGLSTFTPKAEKALAKYGLTISDVSLEFNTFEESMNKLAKANLSANDSFAIFNKRGKQITTVLSDIREKSIDGSDGFAKLKQEMLGQGSVMDFYSSQVDTLDATMQRAKNSTDLFKIAVIEQNRTVISAYANMVGAMANFASTNELVKGSLMGLGQIFNIVLGTAAVGGMAFTIIKVKLAFQSLGTSIKGATGLISKFVMALGAGSAVVIASTIAAVGALAAIIWVLSDAMEKQRKLTQGLTLVNEKYKAGLDAVKTASEDQLKDVNAVLDGTKDISQVNKDLYEVVVATNEKYKTRVESMQTLIGLYEKMTLTESKLAIGSEISTNKTQKEDVLKTVSGGMIWDSVLGIALKLDARQAVLAKDIEYGITNQKEDVTRNAARDFYSIKGESGDKLNDSIEIIMAQYKLYADLVKQGIKLEKNKIKNAEEIAFEDKRTTFTPSQIAYHDYTTGKLAKPETKQFESVMTSGVNEKFNEMVTKEIKEASDKIRKDVVSKGLPEGQTLPEIAKQIAEETNKINEKYLKNKDKIASDIAKELTSDKSLKKLNIDAIQEYSDALAGVVKEATFSMEEYRSSIKGLALSKKNVTSKTELQIIDDKIAEEVKKYKENETIIKNVKNDRNANLGYTKKVSSGLIRSQDIDINKDIIFTPSATGSSSKKQLPNIGDFLSKIWAAFKQIQDKFDTETTKQITEMTLDKKPKSKIDLYKLSREQEMQTRLDVGGKPLRADLEGVTDVVSKFSEGKATKEEMSDALTKLRNSFSTVFGKDSKVYAEITKMTMQLKVEKFDKSKIDGIVTAVSSFTEAIYTQLKNQVDPEKTKSILKDIAENGLDQLPKYTDEFYSTYYETLMEGLRQNGIIPTEDMKNAIKTVIEPYQKQTVEKMTKQMEEDINNIESSFMATTSSGKRKKEIELIKERRKTPYLTIENQITDVGTDITDVQGESANTQKVIERRQQAYNQKRGLLFGTKSPELRDEIEKQMSEINKDIEKEKLKLLDNNKKIEEDETKKRELEIQSINTVISGLNDFANALKSSNNELVKFGGDIFSAISSIGAESVTKSGEKGVKDFATGLENIAGKDNGISGFLTNNAPNIGMGVSIVQASIQVGLAIDNLYNSGVLSDMTEALTNASKQMDKVKTTLEENSKALKDTTKGTPHGELMNQRRNAISGLGSTIADLQGKQSDAARKAGEYAYQETNGLGSIWNALTGQETSNKDKYQKMSDDLLAKIKEMKDLVESEFSSMLEEISSTTGLTASKIIETSIIDGFSNIKEEDLSGVIKTKFAKVFAESSTLFAQYSATGGSDIETQIKKLKDATHDELAGGADYNKTLSDYWTGASKIFLSAEDNAKAYNEELANIVDHSMESLNLNKEEIAIAKSSFDAEVAITKEIESQAKTAEDSFEIRKKFLENANAMMGLTKAEASLKIIQLDLEEKLYNISIKKVEGEDSSLATLYAELEALKANTAEMTVEQNIANDKAIIEKNSAIYAREQAVAKAKLANDQFNQQSDLLKLLNQQSDIDEQINYLNSQAGDVDVEKLNNLQLQSKEVKNQIKLKEQDIANSIVDLNNTVNLASSYVQKQEQIRLLQEKINNAHDLGKIEEEISLTKELVSVLQENVIAMKQTLSDSIFQGIKEGYDKGGRLDLRTMKAKLGDAIYDTISTNIIKAYIDNSGLQDIINQFSNNFENMTVDQMTGFVDQITNYVDTGLSGANGMLKTLWDMKKKLEGGQPIIFFDETNMNNIKKLASSGLSTTTSVKTAISAPTIDTKAMTIQTLSVLDADFKNFQITHKLEGDINVTVDSSGNSTVTKKISMSSHI